MKPPYELNSRILELVAAISEKIGEINASFLIKASPELRKKNQIKTIHASLQIEGNRLSEEQVTAILENKRVLGSAVDIKEVSNAIKVYESLSNYNFTSISSFLNAHKVLMNGLIKHPGIFRKGNVGVVKGSKIEHLAPPAENLTHLMRDLFNYLKSSKETILIKSCVFHYELEFIHPFVDGNGRMGRLWQSIILLSKYPLFQYLSFETLISKSQDEYYKVLSICDKAGNSTRFIEFMLSLILDALNETANQSLSVNMTQDDRLTHFCSLNKHQFSRKDYMKIFKHLSSAAASRDLRIGVEKGLFLKSGDKRNTVYELNE